MGVTPPPSRSGFARKLRLRLVCRLHPGSPRVARLAFHDRRADFFSYLDDFLRRAQRALANEHDGFFRFVKYSRGIAQLQLILTRDLGPRTARRRRPTHG